MKIWILSDLHLPLREALDLRKPDRFPDADICIVAGDICDSMHIAINWLGKVIRPVMPVLFTPGNHEFYDTSITTGRKDARLIADALDVTLLDDSAIEIGDTLFVGGTLWSDFRLYENDSEHFIDQRSAMWRARQELRDYQNITFNDINVSNHIPRRLRPRDTLHLHEQTVRYLSSALETRSAPKAVVVTHFAPHPVAVHEQFRGDPLTPSYVSDLRSLITSSAPNLWVHGHVHHPVDHCHNGTRIICNPRGYAREYGGFDLLRTVHL